MQGNPIPINNCHESEIQVRYAETDAMGFVYYGHYLTYFEVARINALADIGHPYHEMEGKGILIPVLSARVEYKKPARFGDKLIIRSMRHLLGKARVRFSYEVFCKKQLIATGQTTHAFMNRNQKPIRPPVDIAQHFPPLEKTT